MSLYKKNLKKNVKKFVLLLTLKYGTPVLCDIDPDPVDP
jgi:hypothetical protein